MPFAHCARIVDEAWHLAPSAQHFGGLQGFGGVVSRLSELVFQCSQELRLIPSVGHDVRIPEQDNQFDLLLVQFA